MCGSVLLTARSAAPHLIGADLMDFPIIDLMDQEGCRRRLFDRLHPEGFACPRCGAREGPRHPPPTCRLRGRRSPLQRLPPRLQYVHRHPLARDTPGPRADPPDPPWHRQGRAHRDARPRGRDPPPASAPAATCDPGPRAGRRRPRAASRRPHRGRRDVPERGGKKASRTTTRRIRRGGGRTRPWATAPGRPTVRRCPG